MCIKMWSHNGLAASFTGMERFRILSQIVNKKTLTKSQLGDEGWREKLAIMLEK